MKHDEPFQTAMVSRLTGATVLLWITSLAFFLIPYAPAAGDRLWEAWWDFAHVPAFALLALVTLSWSRLACTSRCAPLAMWIVLLLVVPGVEAGQQWTGREFDLQDMVYGWIGCLIGGLWFLGFSVTRRRRAILIALSFILMAGAARIPLLIIRDRMIMRKQFPLLSRFDAKMEGSRWVATGCRIDQDTNGWTLQIQGDAEYPGIFLKDFIRDWRGMQQLILDVVVEGDAPLGIWMRIDDRPGDPPYGERYQENHILNPGTNRLAINALNLSTTSSGRPLDMGEIHTVGLFFDRQDIGRIIRLKQLLLRFSGADDVDRVSPKQ